MKILHVIDSGGLYGAEMMLLNLAWEQNRTGIQAEIASLGEKCINEKPLEEEARQGGIKVHKFRMHPGPNLAGALKIAEFARKNGFDILHSHGYKGNILLGPLPKSMRTPMVATIHGWTSVKGFSKIKIYEWLDHFSLRFIDAVVLVNQGMMSHPAFQKGRLPIFVVNNGISCFPSVHLSGVSEIDPNIKTFCENRFVIGAIGRLSPEKGINYLIDGLNILKKNDKNIRLLLIGEGPERPLLERNIKHLGLSENVLMSGYLPDAARYLSLINVLVMPSLTEGLPITLLEAMRAGVPIVASMVGGIPHVLETNKSGLLVSPGKPDEMAHAIGRLYDSLDLGKSLSFEARKLFERYYTSYQMAISYRTVYEYIASK